MLLFYHFIIFLLKNNLFLKLPLSTVSPVHRIIPVITWSEDAAWLFSNVHPKSLQKNEKISVYIVYNITYNTIDCEKWSIGERVPLVTMILLTPKLFNCFMEIFAEKHQ